METLFEILANLEWWGVLIVLLILTPLYIFKEPIGELLKKIKFRKKIKKRVIKDLRFHDFFNSLEEIKQKVGVIDFSVDGEENRLKTWMMVRLIELKMDSINKAFNDFISIDDIDDVQPEIFKFRVGKCLNDLVDVYNIEAIEQFKMKGVSNEDSRYFVNAYENYRNTIVESFINRLDSICLSSRYDNNFDRLLACLEVSTLAMEVIPRDIRSVYLIINGRFDKYNL